MFSRVPSRHVVVRFVCGDGEKQPHIAGGDVRTDRTATAVTATTSRTLRTVVRAPPKVFRNFRA